MAFGTGTHETTSMCICQLEKYVTPDAKVFDIGCGSGILAIAAASQLEKYVTPDAKVFDIGCGSGILAIAAAKLGANDVTAVDLDEVAVEVAKENVKESNVEEQVTVLHGNLTDVIHDKADVVVANIIADIIKILAKDVQQFMKEDAVFISSGIILAKIDEVVESLEENGFEIVEVIRKGEWSAN